MNLKTMKNYKNKQDFSYMVCFRIGNEKSKKLRAWSKLSETNHIVPDADVKVLLKGLGSRYKVIKRNLREKRVMDKILLDDFNDLMLLQLTYGDLIKQIYKLEMGPN